jgi:hypothetical protein
MYRIYREVGLEPIQMVFEGTGEAAMRIFATLGFGYVLVEVVKVK